ncbi:Uncharacterised protein [Vibrio cholerae]|nr:Uncharacterised protein [Vibrio cholerae]
MSQSTAQERKVTWGCYIALARLLTTSVKRPTACKWQPLLCVVKVVVVRVMVFFSH